MPFDRDAESNELEPHIALSFGSGKPLAPNDLPFVPSAYLFLGHHSCDQDGRIMLTSREMSFEALKGQVDLIKAQLDARLAEAKARFVASLAP